MTTESDTLTISKKQYEYARWGLIILVILLLIALFKLWQETPIITIVPPENNPIVEDGKNPEFSKTTKKFFKSEGYDKVLLIGSNGLGGKVKLVNVEGEDIEPCKLNNGNEFVDIPGVECEDVGKFKFTNLISVDIFFHNPGGNCPIINGIPRCPSKRDKKRRL